EMTIPIPACLLAVFGAVACGNSNTSPPTGRACTAADSFCAGYSYTLCIDVQQGPGNCQDWSRIGATSCPGGPNDCPAMLPSASFPSDSASTPIAICVAKNKQQFRDPPNVPTEAGASEP